MSNKKHKLPQWCKEAKKAMIDLGITGPKELAGMLGMSRSHVSSVLNGRLISDNMRERISSFLNIHPPWH